MISFLPSDIVAPERWAHATQIAETRGECRNEVVPERNGEASDPFMATMNILATPKAQHEGTEAL